MKIRWSYDEDTINIYYSFNIILSGFSLIASSLPLFSLVGVGIGVGLISGSLLYSLSRNFSISSSLISWAFIGFSLVEVSGSIGLCFCFLFLYALFFYIVNSSIIFSEGYLNVFSIIVLVIVCVMLVCIGWFSINSDFFIVNSSMIWSDYSIIISEGLQLLLQLWFMLVVIVWIIDIWFCFIWFSLSLWCILGFLGYMVFMVCFNLVLYYLVNSLCLWCCVDDDDLIDTTDYDSDCDSILLLYVYMVFGGLLISASFIGMIFISIRLNPIYYETSINCCILLNIIFMSYFLFVNELLVLWSNIIQLNSYIYSFWFSSISSSFIILVLFVSFSVIISCIGYLSINESVICLVYIYMFIMVMLHFIGLNNILLSFIVWDWLGIISFACIHFWSSNISSGIKAVIYNKIGDCLYMVYVGYYYVGFLCFVYGDYVSLCSLSWLGYMVCFNYSWISVVLLSCTLLIMMYSNSAQLPFFSWLENAILAPTPISSLLHSSTMVISGVYLGMMYFMNICGLMVSFLVYSVMMCMLGSGLLCALVKGIMLSDMNSIVAYSTISQISYMFLMLCVIWCLVIYHMLVHGVFNSMISLISGSSIHVNYNFQSIYMIRSVSIMIKASFIIAILVLIGSLSNEGIIYSSYYSLCSLWVMDMFLIGGCLTSFYSIGLVWYVCMGVDVSWFLGGYDYVYFDSFMLMVYAVCCNYMEWMFISMFWMSSLYMIHYFFGWLEIGCSFGGYGMCGMVLSYYVMLCWVWLGYVMYWVSMGWYGMVGMFGVLSFSFDYRSMFCYWWVMDWIRSLSISMLSFMVYAVELFVNGCFSLFMGCLGYVSLDYGVYMWVMYMMLVD